MKKKEVDIILPVFNSKKYILTTINSIIKQTYKSWNLILIDDFSTDGTYEVLKKFKKNCKISNKIFIFRQKKNYGQAIARNLALKKSKSTYVAFIDSDDIWKKNKLMSQINFMKVNKYNFTYSDYIILKNKKKKMIITPSVYDYNSFIHNTSIATSTMIIKRKLLKDIYFPDLKLCEDFYFKCILLRKIKRIRVHYHLAIIK